jgi:peptidoglycan/LPS O-acetylase OafA/YrhL
VHIAARRPRRSTAAPSGRELDPKKNSLNLIRLVLAAAVLFSHSFPLSGHEEPQWGGKTLGSWAVIGFFAISGYLITGARFRSDGGRYLINRVVRIFPGYLVCLLVVAFLFAPVVYVAEKGTLQGFLTTPDTPLNYVFVNAFLKVFDYTVAGTLGGVPLPGSWNGAIWSLYFEFFCYVIIGVAAIVPVVRRKPWPIIAMFAVSVLVHAKMPVLAAYVGGNGDFSLLMYLLPYFLGGAVLFVLKEKCPLRGIYAAPALVVSFVAALYAPGWGSQLCAPLMAYVILWIASVLPCPRAVQEHDLSYGVYIYAWPVTQLLVFFGVHQHGMVLLDLCIVAATTLAAAGSWFLVERPAKALVARRPGSAARKQDVAPAVSRRTTRIPVPAVPVALPEAAGAASVHLGERASA